MNTVMPMSPEQQEALQGVREAYRRVYDGETVIMEYEYRMPDGKMRSFESSWVPVWNNGEVVAAGEVTRDITHRKKEE